MVLTPAELKEIRAYLDDIPFKHAAPLVNYFAKKEMEAAVLEAANQRSKDLAAEIERKRDEEAKNATPPPQTLN